MRLLRGLLTTLLVFSGFTQDAQAHSTRRNPLRRTRQIEDVRFSTRDQQVHASSRFEATFSVSGANARVKLALEPNHDVISSETYIEVIEADGSRHAMPLDRSEHKVFRGDAFVQQLWIDGSSRWRNAGWARIMVVSDGAAPVFEGVFSIDGDNHHVQTRTNYLRTRQSRDALPATSNGPETMVLWRDSDVAEDEHGRHDLKRDLVATQAACGVNNKLHLRVEANETEQGTAFSVRDVQASMFGSSSVQKRQNPLDTIGSTAGCPTTRRVALMGVATDCEYTQDFASEAQVRSNVIAQVNSASALFERTFNVALAIRNMTISRRDCPATTTPGVDDWNRPCSANVDVGTRLSRFSQWRGNQRDDNAFWTLMSRCSSGSAVGIAWLGALCMQRSQTDNRGTFVAGANYVARVNNEWQVLAHEIGHTFGAEHDCVTGTCSGTTATDECCPLSQTSCDARGQYLMNPSARPGITDFSPCSIGSVCSQLGSTRSMSRCLVDNNSVETAEGFAACGNGVVEPGEQCDSDNPCCDRSTCRYAANAVCDPASDACCTDTCGVAPSGRVCRASTGSCDPQETCNGSSATCPADVVTGSCNNGGDGVITNGGGGGNGGGTGLDDVGDWFSRNRNIVIGVAAGVGGLIILLILGCMISSIRRKRRVKHQQRQLLANRGSTMSPPTGFGGPTRAPPPAYYPGNAGGGMTQAWPSRPARTFSARYA